ncbi:phytoene desaturase [Sphingomicrobium sediminis]|uniref:Phytoene dehydrogenase n=1 Tax=Sphingomicrobium sediminis TaxID=2950949 RepID=A0A9X2EE44_9SPHN|nr:phytoene desaturase [Sphingomicrobium sediminis]MCM8556248.1 phytoene desaturase [Sphingomicrobium sediminis]
MKTAIVIGSGFGGLALAIRLQSAGIQTTIVEARDKPGGRAYYWERDGHVFDGGPTVITDPDCLKALWKLSNQKLSDDVDLVPVDPFYALDWPDGVRFDYTNDDQRLFTQINKLNPDDVEGYKKFLDYSAGVFHEGYEKLGTKAFLSLGDMLKAAPSLAKYQAWRSVYSIVAQYVKEPHLRQALSFHTLLVGGNPMTCSSVYALIHKLERDGGVWFAMGGTNRLIAGMVALFERLGGTIRLGDAVTKIETAGDKVTGVTTASGWTGTADAIASNGDVVATYGLIDHPRGPKMHKKMAKKRFSPSLFVLHFGLEGTCPDVPHHMIMFGPRYKGLLKDIYNKGNLATDPSLYLHHPTKTDPSMAPEGCSTFYALAPVPHMGKADVDWDKFGAEYAEVVYDTLEERLIPDIRKRIRTQFHYTPKDFQTDLFAHLGSAFSLEPVLTQSAYFRTHNRDDKLSNLYFVGAGTHPGAGIPGVVGSAEATAELMLG